MERNGREGGSECVALPVQWEAGLGTGLWVATVSSANLQRVFPSGKELYVFMESQMRCDYCFKGYIFSLCVDRCICAGYSSISTWVDEGSSTLQVSLWRCWYTAAVYIK